MNRLNSAAPKREAFDAIFRDVRALLGGDDDLLRLIYGLRCLYVTAQKGDEMLLPGCIHVWVAHGTIHLASVAAIWSKREWISFCVAVHLIRQVGVNDLLDALASEKY